MPEVAEPVQDATLFSAIDAAAANLTPDTTTAATRAIYVGTSGNVAVTMVSGAQVTFVGVQGVLPVSIVKLKSTSNGTSASNIVLLF